MMSKVNVLLEFEQETPEAFARFEAMSASDHEAERQAQSLVENLAGLGIELDERSVPVPMFARGDEGDRTVLTRFAAFAAPTVNPEETARGVVVAVDVDRGRMDELAHRPGVTVWPNSELTLLNGDDEDPIDQASSKGGLDCRPFRAGVSIAVIRRLLGVDGVWQDGYRGQNVVVGIIDEGVNGEHYPVVGGFSRPNAGRRPGTAPITSHGSMCAADVLIAAPAARLYDYPFLGVPNSGGALQMFQAVLDQRRLDGTPHLTNNSYGFVGVPDPRQWPNHEVHNLNHPLHRKVREVVAAGIACFFAAGNCGADCPSGACHPSGIGAGRSIHASNSLAEVVTVAAVNSRHERIGYSSQGPGMFETQKPDLAAYSHFFANYGPGRPAGTSQPFDNGTSAATPVAAGVAALLLSAFPDLDPDRLKQVLNGTATRLGETRDFDHDHGHGVINAAAAYRWLRNRAPALS
ncbi:MAG: hypothetical protein EA405_00970 [Rhodospirillales bacterium]|nr:MAG: hypothetical protein EA405_00970 [Rhodospirillales bacterium]